MVAGGAAEFIARFALEQVGDDTFTGRCHAGSPLRAFGGQVAAQALMAAGRTIDDERRRVHSMHCYFLRPGNPRAEMCYDVDRPRDGGSFSFRSVQAKQDGIVVFMLTASFSTDDPGPEHQFAQPQTPGPDSGGEIPLFHRRQPDMADDLKVDYPEELLIEMRSTQDEDGSLEMGPDGRYERNTWVRVAVPLPDDPLLHACAFTYISDLGMSSTSFAPHRGQRRSLQVASIDHAVWFHNSLRVDEWMLFARDTPVARHGHGLARAIAYDTSGRLIASMVQESLMRTMRPRP